MKVLGLVVILALMSLAAAISARFDRELRHDMFDMASHDQAEVAIIDEHETSEQAVSERFESFVSHAQRHARLSELKDSDDMEEAELIEESQTHSSVLKTATDEEDVRVHKSPFDNRKYRFLKLENGLSVLLVSDNTTTKAAVAMDVGQGAYGDPEIAPGLAHFLEHMLFLGTKKFPKEDAYDGYLSTFGGMANAYTDKQHTNFYFDIQAGHLKGALERFSQFFIAPLLTESATGREMNAVNAEHMKNLQNDDWREFNLLNNFANIFHPMHKFSTGSLATLTVVDKPTLRETLLVFWKKWYTAGNMRLAIIGREPLSTLEEWTRQLFSEIRGSEPNFNPDEWQPLEWSLKDTNGIKKGLPPSLTKEALAASLAEDVETKAAAAKASKQAAGVLAPVKNAAAKTHLEELYDAVHDPFHGTPLSFKRIFSPEKLGNIVLFKSVKQRRKLVLYFPLPHLNFRHKSVEYICQLVSTQSEGSLYHTLKESGLALAVDTGAATSTNQFDVLSITVKLTPAGLKKPAAVINTIFAYLKMIRQTGIQKWRYEEYGRLSHIDFEMKSKEKPIRIVSKLARNLKEFGFQNVLNGDYLFEDFHPEEIDALLSLMDASNMIAFVSSADMNKRVELTHKEKWYKTEYAVQAIPAALKKMWTTGGPHRAEQVATQEVPAPSTTRFAQSGENNQQLDKMLDKMFGKPVTRVEMIDAVLSDAAPKSQAFVEFDLSFKKSDQAKFSATCTGCSFQTAASTKLVAAAAEYSEEATEIPAFVEHAAHAAPAEEPIPFKLTVQDAEKNVVVLDNLRLPEANPWVPHDEDLTLQPLPPKDKLLKLSDKQQRALPPTPGNNNLLREPVSGKKKEKKEGKSIKELMNEIPPLPASTDRFPEVKGKLTKNEAGKVANGKANENSVAPSFIEEFQSIKDEDEDEDELDEEEDSVEDEKEDSAEDEEEEEEEDEEGAEDGVDKTDADLLEKELDQEAQMQEELREAEKESNDAARFQQRKKKKHGKKGAKHGKGKKGKHGKRKLRRIRLPKLSPVEKNNDQTRNPVIIRESDKPQAQRVWFLQDRVYRRPRVNVRARFWSPLVYTNARSYTTAAILVLLLEDSLLTFAYPTGLAGFAYEIGAGVYGIDVALTGYGYNDLMQRYATHIFQAIADVKRTDKLEKRFQVVKSRLREAWINARYSAPHAYSKYIADFVLHQPRYSTDTLALELSSLSLSDVLVFHHSFWTDVAVEIFYHGNLTPQQALTLTDALNTAIKSYRTLSQPFSLQYRGLRLVDRRVTKLPGQFIIQTTLPNRKDKNSALYNHYQYGQGTAEASIYNSILSLFAQRPAFHQLRANEQLGYIVWAYDDSRDGVQGFCIRVQSGVKPAQYLAERVRVFTRSLSKMIHGLSPKQWRTLLRTLITHKLKPALTLDDQTRKFWAHIQAQRYRFDYYKTQVQLIRKRMPYLRRRFVRYVDELLGIKHNPRAGADKSADFRFLSVQVNPFGRHYTIADGVDMNKKFEAKADKKKKKYRHPRLREILLLDNDRDAGEEDSDTEGLVALEDEITDELTPQEQAEDEAAENQVDEFVFMEMEQDLARIQEADMSEHSSMELEDALESTNEEFAVAARSGTYLDAEGHETAQVSLEDISRIPVTVTYKRYRRGTKVVPMLMQHLKAVSDELPQYPMRGVGQLPPIFNPSSYNGGVIETPKSKSDKLVNKH